MTAKRASGEKRIEDQIVHENWDNARKLIKAELRNNPKDHWLLSRLSLTYYEQREYAKALEFSVQALTEAPSCPLALWDHAGTLEMLGRTNEALAIYQRLIKRGVHRIAFDVCGEGVSWSRGLVADCWYRLAHCYNSLEEAKKSARAYKRHLAMRGPGCRSIYPLRIVRDELSQLDKQIVSS